MRSKSKTKTKVEPLIDSQNMHVKEEEEEQICEILNQYFSSVFTLERPEGLMELENRLNQEKVASNLNKVFTLRTSEAGIPALRKLPCGIARRQYRLCANFPVASEAGIPAARYVNARRRTPVYRLCFLMRTGT